MAHRELIDRLLVEDDEFDIMIMQRAFKHNKISTPLQIARDGVDALATLRSE